MSTARILVVDDEPGMLEVCAETLQKLPDVEIVTESRSERAAEILLSRPIDLLITDIRMPGLDGVELIRRAREHDAGMAILAITAFPTVETAVESMKLGAADYIVKPFLSEDLLATVGRLLEAKRLREENDVLRRHMERPYSFDEIVGQCEPMRAVFDAVQKLAPVDVDVLISGETGTGKELVARSLHKRSRRAAGRFVPVDCGAIPESLLESEFFGHERGAFTSAATRSLGLMELAHGGSLFLDEVGELPLPLQAKLLRALQERKVRRVGGKEEIPVDVRVIAATRRDLAAEVAGRRFRDDLYYRINVARVTIPPLRERSEDVPLLVRHFLERYGREMGKTETGFDPEVLEILTNYPWPGNVRELQNTVKRMLAMAPGATVTPADVPDEIVVKAAEAPGRPRKGFFLLREQRIAAFEKEYLTNLLATHGGEVTHATREAQIPRATFYRMLARHGLDPADFRR